MGFQLVKRIYFCLVSSYCVSCARSFISDIQVQVMYNSTGCFAFCLCLCVCACVRMYVALFFPALKDEGNVFKA